jgi:ribosomal protein S18 acetylase RimI-like enzyme
MIEIRPLTNLEPQELRSLNVGYISTAMYRVRKSETPQETIFQLELVPLGQPYIKRWETDDEELVQLEEAVHQGLSLAAYDGTHMIAIAIAEARRWNRTLWVWEFHVAPEYRRKGIGRQLMQALAEKARSANLRVMVCETQNTNVPAISFYRQVGFTIDGIDLSYYTNRDLTDGEVAIFMKRKL